MDGIRRSCEWDKQVMWMGQGNFAQCFAYGTACLVQEVGEKLISHTLF